MIMVPKHSLTKAMVDNDDNKSTSSMDEEEEKSDVSQQTLNKCYQKIVMLKQKIKQKKKEIHKILMNYSNHIQNDNMDTVQVDNVNQNKKINDENTNHLYNIYCVYDKQYNDDLKWADDDDENLSLQQFASDPSWIVMDSHNYNNYNTDDNDNNDTAKMHNNDSNNSNNSNSSDNSSKGSIDDNNHCDFGTLHVNIRSKTKNSINNAISTKRVISGAIYHPVMEDEEDTPPDDADETLTIDNNTMIMINGEEHEEHCDGDHDKYHNKYVRIVTRSNSLNKDNNLYHHHFQSVQSDLDQSNNNSKSTSSTDRLNINVEADVTFKVSQTLKGHTGKVYAFDISRDDESIISCGHDGFMLLWDIESQQKRLAVKLQSRYITYAKYCNFDSTFKTLVACAGLDKILYVYDLTNNYGLQLHKDGNKNQCLLSSLSKHEAYISCIKPLPDYKILTSSGDASCILWDIVKSEDIVQFRSDSSSDFTTMETFDTLNRNIFMTGSVDGYIRMYDLRQKEHIHKFINHDKNKKIDVNMVKAFKNNTSFVAGSEDGNIRFYDFRSYQQLNYYEVNNDILDSTSLSNINGVSCIDFSKSGSFLFNTFEYKEPNSSLNKNVNSRGSLVNNCIVRHTVTGQKIDDLRSDSPVTWLNVANNGKFIVTSHINKTLRVWKPQKKRRSKSRNIRSYSSYSK